MKSIDKRAAARVQEWLDGPYDEATKEAIRRLIEKDPKELESAFFKHLSFGTGGMREIMGPGTNRLNVYTIRRATQGLANYIKKQPGSDMAVFIGYDVRRNSKLFAEETASVLAGNGIRVYLTKDICPTPLVSFGCRYFECQAAVMITASHNPPEYNGYKVYWSDGAQVVPPHDLGIVKEVENVEGEIPLGDLLPPLVHYVGSELDQAYLIEAKKLQLHPELSGSPIKIVYSPLHGTGIRIIPDALKSWGYSRVSLVEKQSSPDGDFSFAPSPNPEDQKALHLGVEQMEEEGADLFIATDPDADRIGVVGRGKIPREIQESGIGQEGSSDFLAGARDIAKGKDRSEDEKYEAKPTPHQNRVLNPDRHKWLTGNHMGCILLHHIASSLANKNELPPNAAFVKTIVTTELFKKIAEDFGAACIDVLTGFKYIGEKIAEWEKSFGGYQYIFGAEESYGCLFGTFVRDKDAVSAACLIAEAAALAKSEGITLADRLLQLYKKYGIHREGLANLSFGNAQSGMEEMQKLMKKLRDNPPREIGGRGVREVEDYLSGKMPLPPSNVLRFWLEDKSKIVIRPSGTEPKIKIYAEVVDEKAGDIEIGVAAADLRLKTLIASFQKECLS